jgi:hypothetical protein
MKQFLANYADDIQGAAFALFLFAGVFIICAAVLAAPYAKKPPVCSTYPVAVTMSNGETEKTEMIPMELCK